jgi:hypothetical protein
MLKAAEKMRNIDIILLLTANANKSEHVRVFSGRWYTGADRIPDVIAANIGKLINLIEAQINQGNLCNKDEESLLIYNVQLSGIDSQITIDMVRRSRQLLDCADNLVGSPVHLLIDMDSGMVRNPTSAMLHAGMISSEEVVHENLEQPKEYGRLHDYAAPTTYASMETDEDIDFDGIFHGAYDRSPNVEKLGNVSAHVTLQDAFAQLHSSPRSTRAVLEVAGPETELERIFAAGISKYVTKVLVPTSAKVKLSENKVAAAKEKLAHDEISRLFQAHPQFQEVKGPAKHLTDPSS